MLMIQTGLLRVEPNNVKSLGYTLHACGSVGEIVLYTCDTYCSRNGGIDADDILLNGDNK